MLTYKRVISLDSPWISKIWTGKHMGKGAASCSEAMLIRLKIPRKNRRHLLCSNHVNTLEDNFVVRCEAGAGCCPGNAMELREGNASMQDGVLWLTP